MPAVRPVGWRRVPQLRRRSLWRSCSERQARAHEAVDTVHPMVVHETFREQAGPGFCRQEAAVNQLHIFRSDARSGKGPRRITEKRFQPRVRGREIVGLTGEGIVARSDD